MKLTIKKEILSNVVKAVLVMQDKTNVIFKPEGLSVVLTSLDHTAMAIINLPKENFDSYEVESEVKFGIDASALKTKLARLDKIVDVEITDKVVVKSQGLRYGLPLAQCEDKGKEPSISSTAKITLPLEELRRFVDDVKTVAGKMKITVKDGSVLFYGKGELPDDFVERTPELSNVEGTAESFYSLDYLKRMVDAVDAETVIMEFSNNLPLKLTLGPVKYFLGSWVAN